MFFPNPLAEFMRAVLSETFGDLLASLVKKKSNYFGEKTLSIQESELMQMMKTEMEKQAAKNEYLQSDISRLLNQQNQLLAAFIQYVNENQKQISVSNENHSLRFALPADTHASHSVGYPIKYIHSGATRYLVILIFERCALDSGCLDYNAVVSNFLSYIRSSKIKNLTDIMICTCNLSRPDLYCNLSPVAHVDTVRLDRKIYDHDGESLLLAKQAFEQAKKFYGDHVLPVKAPAFFYLTQCNNNSSDRLSYEMNSMSEYCAQNHSLFAVVSLDKDLQVPASLIINRECAGDENNAAYSMMEKICDFYALKKPVRIVSSKESISEVSIDGFFEKKATKRRST